MNKTGVQRSVKAGLRQAVHDGRVDAVLDGPLMAMAESLAAQIDDARAEGLYSPAAKLAAELRQCLVQLGMRPAARTGEQKSEFDEFLSALSSSA